jgi:DNA-directed RNA polymerase specialized sigma24 family protein
MTTHRSTLSLISEHLAQLSTSRRAALTLAGLASSGIDTGAEPDLLATLESTQRGAGRLALLGSLVALAATDEMAALGALVVMAPELRRMARLLSGPPFDPDEAEAEVVAIAWEVLTRRRPDGAGSLPVPVLFDAIWTEVRRMGGLRRGQLALVPLDDEHDMPTPESDPLERWPALLAAAVAGRVLSPRQMVLIAQTRMEGRPLTEVAAHLHRPYSTAAKERAKAEAALRAFALEYYAEGPR